MPCETRRRPERSLIAAPFFEQINSALPPNSIPHIDPGFLGALKRLFSVSFLISGSFFALGAVLSIRDLSGKLALASAVLCIVLGLTFRVKRRPAKDASQATF
jgi:hypothetical protein